MEIVLRNVRLSLGTVGRRCVNHEEKALFSSRELGDVTFRVSSTNVLLHGAVALFLKAETTAEKLIKVSRERIEIKGREGARDSRCKPKKKQISEK